MPTPINEPTDIVVDEDSLDGERRIDGERRQRFAFSLVYGGLKPRRRGPRRDRDRFGFFADWHESNLLYSAIGVLLLCGTDAVLTLNLLRYGAIELNPLMANLIRIDIQLFAAIKMGITALSLVLLVVLANCRFVGRVRVSHLVYGAFLAYLLLISYELAAMAAAI